MKLLLLALLTTFSFSSEINWLKYKEALSKQDKKPIFYVLSASYCEFCKKDMKLIKEDEKLSKYISDNFIAVYEERDVDIVPKYLDKEFTPIYYILGEKGEILDTLRGTQTKLGFTQFLNKNLYKWRNK